MSVMLIFKKYNDCKYMLNYWKYNNYRVIDIGGLDNRLANGNDVRCR